jgi:hypothetical protein
LRTPNGNQLVVPPHQPGTTVGDLSITVLLDSKNTNGVFWRTSTLTDANGNPIPTKFFAGTFVAKAHSPLTYTFTNGGTEDILVDSILLGSSPSLIDAQTFSPSVLANVHTFPQGLTLAPGDSILINVPFDLPVGEFLVADILGTGDPGTSDPIALQFIDQHQSVPEPGTLASIVCYRGGRDCPLRTTTNVEIACQTKFLPRASPPGRNRLFAHALKFFTYIRPARA